MQQVEKIFMSGIRFVISYDNVDQLYTDQCCPTDFSSIRIKRKQPCLHSEWFPLNFAFPRNSPNTRIAPVKDVVGFVRDRLSNYDYDMPSWVVAMEMLDTTDLQLNVDDVARVIRNERGHTPMPKLPALDEVVHWLVRKESLDVWDGKVYNDLLDRCNEYFSIGSYLNPGNLRKVIGKMRQTTSTAHLPV